jgi:DNA sulfur modification protein DndD
MLINEIQLTNIGPYRGINSFDLRPEDEKNVILVGGENGAGKTTLLNAIKLGLFGSYGYGYKSENVEYYNRVQALLNKDAKKIDENNFRIQLNISLVDNFEKVDYTLYRFWKYTNNKLKETFEVVANGKHYSDYDKEIFQSKLKEIMPPHLLDLCLFDGEEISRIVNEGLLADYLKNLSRVVFNLDLFETMEVDLENYSNQNFDVNKMASMEKDMFELNTKEKELKNKISPIISLINELTNKRKEHVDDYQLIKNDFEKYGGLVKAERDDILTQISVIENKRKQNIENVKEFVSNTLPFFLAKDLLLESREQIKEEEQFQLYKQMDQKLTEDSLGNILSSIPGTFDNSTSSVLKEKLLNLMKPKTETIQIHGASFSESSLIENMALTVSSDLDKKNLNTIEGNKVLLQDLHELRQKLKNNDSTNEFSEMIQDMELHQESIQKIDDQLKDHQKELSRLKEELNQTISSLERIQNTLKDQDKTRSSFLESQKIIALSRRFREVQLQKKLQQVQIEASNMLKKIFRKQNYVSYIKIDHRSYDVTLYDEQKEEIEKTTLSAGEKEILLISLIWAIFKCSGRKVPFIFDTLLGRLDKTHKAAVLSEFIPNCGRQAIILSTDTEIDDQHYKTLSNQVAKEYMLDFNVEKQQTRILNQYFSFNKMELSV